MVVYDHVLDKNNEYEGLYNENIEYIQGYTNKLSAQYYIIPGKIKWNYSQEFSNVDELVQKSKQIIDSKLELL